MIEPLPHYATIEHWLKTALQMQQKRPLFLGINGPQGSGKSTLATYLREHLALESYRIIAISIDDFYLSRNEQIRLAAQFAHNPYLQARGYPGTHDIALGTQILFQLRKGKSVALPVYDKAAHNGKGDRSAETKLVQGPLDLIILEGWMLGFEPLPEEKIRDPFLLPSNNFLKNYQAWYGFDLFLHLEAVPLSNVVEWRVEAEQKLRNAGKGAMSETEVRDYVSLFLPAYEHYVPWLKQNYPVPQERLLHIELNKLRQLF